MSKIKICGLFRTEDVAVANLYKPDYIGFVFAPSKRQVSFEQALEIKKALSDSIASVGVFVNAEIEEIIQCAEGGICDIIQLHGEENEDYITKLKSLIRIPVIKAVKVDCKEDILSKNSSAADYLLLDNGHGGTGERFDWKLAKFCTKPYFLAGGIDPCNIDEALKLKPFCIDTSSGVETCGVKDADKIGALVKAVRKFS